MNTEHGEMVTPGSQLGNRQPAKLRPLKPIAKFPKKAPISLRSNSRQLSYFVTCAAGGSRQGLKLGVFVVLGGVLALGVFAAAQTIPQVANLLGQRATFEQSYDVGPRDDCQR